MNDRFHPDKRKVSALDSTLKLLSEKYRKVRHYVGVMLIDKFMRNSVEWYDQHHSKKSVLNTHDADQISSLNQKLKESEREREAMQDRLLEEREKLRDVRIKFQSLETSFSALKSDFEALENNNRKLSNLIETLNEQNSNLARKCLPEDEIPSMTYYAQGDATGLYLRKLSTIKGEEQIYTLHTSPGNTHIAEFYPLIKGNVNEIIANRNLTLLACDIMGISQNPGSIEVISFGKAQFQNNKWAVINKAKIRII